MPCQTTSLQMEDPVDLKPGERLKITEIFLSLQGESNSVGWPTVFVRLTGCPLRCVYCDTAYAFYGGEWRLIDEIVSEVRAHGVRHVCVTGGEPLAQKRCLILLRKLCDAGLIVSLETSGALDVSMVDQRVHRVIDIKTPGSKEETRNYWPNIDVLTPRDQIKFVICSREDFDWAMQIIDVHHLAARCDVLFSPSYGQVDPTELAEWILQSKAPVRYQLQLHKVLWNDARGK